MFKNETSPAESDFPAVSERPRRGIEEPVIARRRERAGFPWHLAMLGVIAIVVIVLAITEIGTPTSTARTSTETVSAENGVVQTTVSGSGNVEPATDVSLNFNTSGTLEHVYVTVGEYVANGQLIATLDDSSQELALKQAKEQLKAAEYNLTQAKEGKSTSATGSSASTGAAASYTGASPSTEFVSDTNSATTTTPTTTTPTPTTTTPTPTTTTHTPTTTRTTSTTTPTVTTPKPGVRRASRRAKGRRAGCPHRVSVVPLPRARRRPRRRILRRSRRLKHRRTALSRV